MSTDTHAAMTAFAPAVFPSTGPGPDPLGQERAHRLGHAAGYAAGLRAARATLAERLADLEADHERRDAVRSASIATAVAALSAAAARLDARETTTLLEAQDQLAAAAVDLAEAVLGMELAYGDTSARAALARALAGVRHEPQRTVRMNPDDVAALAGTVVPAELVGDPALARGDAMVDLDDGFLDAGIGAALGRARAALTEDPS
ncbi:FliH/SctL family protein [Occultella aeris]|uniref:Flagellar assembly protein FliH n=1 Tax=Occultella aeris TaxID=2761496 RepID=A0A7M4DDH1_9MICO|nr:FliH/SctL family protein [Occultella aeris]VZO34890.1 Flagellar assembly protein FliH [Occultella aeris]